MKGFILVELIVVMGLVGIFTALSVAGFVNFEKFFLSRSVKNEAITILDRARNLSISMYQNSGWSFKVEANKFLIYKGSDFENREENFDEYYDLPSKTSATTTSDIYFEPITGFSNSAVVTVNSGTSTYEILVNNNGIIK